MLRVALTTRDLEQVQVALRPAPMLELRTALRQPLAHGVGPTRHEHRADVDLVRSLVAHPCAPGFLFPAASDQDDAIDTIVRTHRDLIRRDLEDNDAAGFPLPSWSLELTRPGYAGTRARTRLQVALTHVASTYIAPRIQWMQPLVSVHTRAWQHTTTTHGGRALLSALHPSIRWTGGVLEIDLASGAEIDVATTGSGIRVIPTLAPIPSATLSSDGGSPLVLNCPVPLPAERATGGGRCSDPGLEQLIGFSRSNLMRVIATHPGLGIRELARRSGLAPASVSDHTKILRNAGIAGATTDGTRTTYTLTPLGWALLLRATTST